MSREILLIALDLGTSSTTARFSHVRDTRDATGKVHRRPLLNRALIEMKDWPGGHKGDAIEKACLPTDLYVILRSHCLLFEVSREDFTPKTAPEK